SNITSVFKQCTFNAFVSVGMLLCLITAGIELSVGANAIFCSCLMGMMVQMGMQNGVLMVIVAIIAGTLVGFVNGVLLTRLHLPHPFVSTLGMKNVLWGAALLVTSSQMVSGFPKAATWFGHSDIKGFPVAFIFVIVLYVVMQIFL